jgi:acyl-coenzyme A synthetase/AMP-(fatty) acid ligase
MQQGEFGSLWERVRAAGSLSERFLSGADTAVTLDRLLGASSLDAELQELRGRSVLLLVTDQLQAALALIELDGIARRIVLCPPDVADEHIPAVILQAEVDAIVSDWEDAKLRNLASVRHIACGTELRSGDPDRTKTVSTEWILFTSGTVGQPKLVVHTLFSLTGAIRNSTGPAASPVWSTLYDIRRYGGLQILLRSLLQGSSLVLSSGKEPLEDFLARAGQHHISNISGTPSHWRRVLISTSAGSISPQYIRLSGEIADQAVLDQLRAFYPNARIVHAFASTEAGVAFEVHDGLSGFPAQFVGQQDAEVEMRVQEGSLRIRSARTASRYLGTQMPSLRDSEGFVDTSDLVELRDDRYYFVGRKDGVINVGGLKVHPEEVEAVINRHHKVQISAVKSRFNAITGGIVVADVVLKPGSSAGADVANDAGLRSELIKHCRIFLPPHKVPASIRFVPSLQLTTSGKLARS